MIEVLEFHCKFRYKKVFTNDMFSVETPNDLSVDREDFTFSDTCQESDRFIPGFGEGVACAWNYDRKPWYNCSLPGFFVINMNGTGLVVDRDLTWDYRTYQSVTGEDTFTRSPDGLKITAFVDGYCAEVVPNATMYLKHDRELEVWGSATEPVCSSP
ncbi:hypothetical protein KP79_PYT24167 [Mizuhopecten yessoensis]|uniref:GON domain-containing protein n=1 Tax=Mizuhopecten yessoensis TaxID=6573 RepID=A0A210Q407_MIZYE|nr:hypothetical protein KP79_PYT24167 [Mizuhopecten yessoensis]